MAGGAANHSGRAFLTPKNSKPFIDCICAGNHRVPLYQNEKEKNPNLLRLEPEDVGILLILSADGE